MTLKKTEAQEPQNSTDAEGNPTTVQPEPKVTWVDVYAPATGTVKYKVIRDQETPVGTVVATVTPGTYSAKGTVKASQQYRLTSAPGEASVSVDSGPAPFTCTDLKIGSKETTGSGTGTATGADTSGLGAASTPEDSDKVEVRCTVPADQQVFPGLKATIDIDAGSATGALLVPGLRSAMREASTSSLRPTSAGSGSRSEDRSWTTAPPTGARREGEGGCNAPSEACSHCMGSAGETRMGRSGSATPRACPAATAPP